MADATKKIGDTKLAARVIDAYADGLDALTLDKCMAQGVDAGRCGVLRSVLEKGVGGEVSDYEKRLLDLADFSKEFIDEITGIDGKRALGARAKWLGDNCVKKPWRLNRDFPERETMLKELGEMGPGAKEAVPDLVRAIKTGGDGGQTRYLAIQALANMGSEAGDGILALIDAAAHPMFDDDSSARYALIRIGAAAVPWLAYALEDEDRSIHSAAAYTLLFMGNAAHPAIPFLERMRDEDAHEDCRLTARMALDNILKDVK